MIVGIFHQGSGLGNQLHRYVATRVKAHDLGVDWGMIYNPDGSGKEEGFKGKSFMDFDNTKMFNIPNNIPKLLEYQTFDEKIIKEDNLIENNLDIRSYDPEFNFIKYNTIIDGEFQDERYWEHREKEVNEWLKVEPLSIKNDVCVIGFRGGEFKVFPNLFLPKEYWLRAINMMIQINPNMKFEVHTDDEALAKEYFPDLKVIHDVGINWRAMRYAKYAIIANSSFYILPRWLNKGMTIAPRYWARRNTKTWALPQNYYKRFIYI